MADARREFPYDLVLMLGDNFYGSQRPADLVKKFELPYKPLLDAGVRFQAAIGNHDEPASVDYPPLNMGGRRYYTFARRNVRFFVLDTNALDPPQLRWLETELTGRARGLEDRATSITLCTAMPGGTAPPSISDSSSSRYS